MEPGAGWRKHCWTHARKNLLPQLPLEVIRLRLRRAQQLGLPYATYNTVRTTTGQDIIAFLFSTNALGMQGVVAQLPQDRAAKLRQVTGCGTLAAAQPPLTPERAQAHLAQAGVEAHTFTAPGLASSWSDTAQHLKSVLRAKKLAGDKVLVIGETALEKEWCGAGGMAGFLTGRAYFTPDDLRP